MPIVNKQSGKRSYDLIFSDGGDTSANDFWPCQIKKVKIYAFL